MASDQKMGYASTTEAENTSKKRETANADNGINHGTHGIHGKTEKDGASPSVYSVVCDSRIVLVPRSRPRPIFILCGAAGGM
jgi:hypothetical protein